MIEIGCGVGSAGIAIAPLCRSILLTDGSPEAVRLAAANAAASGRTNVQCEQMAWDEASVADVVRRHGTFDVVVGSDLIYYRVRAPARA